MNIIDEKTTKLFKEWSLKVEKLKTVENDIKHLKINILNAKKNLGEYLCPHDALIGEKFSIWIDGKFLNIDKLNNNDFNIYWRESKK